MVRGDPGLPVHHPLEPRGLPYAGQEDLVEDLVEDLMQYRGIQVPTVPFAIPQYLANRRWDSTTHIYTFYS